MVEDEDISEDYLKFLPRNLSYTEEGYLDNFSVCASFVKEPKTRKVQTKVSTEASSYFESFLRRCTFGCGKEASDAKISIMCDNSSEGYVELDDGSTRGARLGHGTKVKKDMVDKAPDLVLSCEVASEEGIFVNMMDDLDSVIESPQSRGSEGSDGCYFSLESAGSPAEGEEGDRTQDAKSFSESVTKELAKTELRKSVSEGSIEDKSNGTEELKKASSETSLSPKFADLKLQISGGGFTSDTRKYLLEVPESPTYEDSEFNINKSQLRKSSSLKTNKTPPGTPRRKKMVRFADAMGLDLESIRHVLDTELPPKIPASAVADLKAGVEEDRQHMGSRYLDLCFKQPGAEDRFVSKVMANKVSLENCIITDLNITGIVRVANIGYHKCVRVRYSINNWVTFYDVMASYVQNSCDGPTDRFSFTIVAPAALGPGSKISFAVSYTVNDTMYWDNNNGSNYEVVCYAKTTPTELESSWLHFV